MSGQPSTSDAYYRDHRWDQDPESEFDDDNPGTVNNSEEEKPKKTNSGSYPFSPGNESDGSDNDKVSTRRRPTIRRNSAKKIQARSKGGQFVKKSICSDSKNEEEQEEEMESPTKKNMENKSKAAIALSWSRQQLTEVERNRNKMLNRRKKAQWAAAEKAQAARDLERTSSGKRERPLNRYIQSRPPPSESDDEPKAPPPPPTEEELAARLAKKEERHRIYMEGKAKRQEELAKKRETERNRRLFPDSFSRKPARGSIEGVFSTRTTDRTGKTTTWEQWRRVIWCDEEKKAEEWKRRVKENRKQVRPLKPRTGPAANNGVYAIESRRQLEKDPNDNGFHYIARRIKKKEETDSEELDDDEEHKEPKNRLHSAATRQILKDAFEEAQYLSEESAKKLMRATKLTLRQVKAWFQNTRNKTWSSFRKGKIAVLPGQMKVMDDMNKERVERGEHLRMKEESEEELEDSDDGGEDESGEDGGEDQEDEEDVEEGGERDSGNRVDQKKKVIDHLSTEGYPVYPGWR
ncbi:hypothetical protein CAEBREN_15457 [Caenorhabditis brenneri]|uniref:Homeobox domain-containing protein n=1 Tax=Caenorhabditis brenneri TaxID=135651 RepID=G0MCW3_CAEBE|nr:hypothetical protein CAEBREN_15457 [Caenorhabditis brenneri]